MAHPTIITLDVHDDTLLREWHAMEHACVAHDRPDAVSRTWDALASSWRNPSPYFRPSPLAAVAEGRVVGIADLGYTLEDNTHLAALEISVLPELRRRGIGRALYDDATRRRRDEGRTSASGELHIVGGDEGPLDFARAMGAESAHVEDHLVLGLPVDPTEPPGSLEVEPAASYEVLTWRGRCPDDLLDDYCRMRTQMNADVPVGELDHEPVVMTPERVRAGEERLARAYDTVVAVARGGDGQLVGYSLVYLPHGTDQALQDDTLVMPGHRGHRLGLALKLATLRVMGSEHPERRSLHTWTDPDNGAMCATNAAFGYRPVERMHEVQVKD